MTNFNFTFQPGTSSEQIIGFEMAGRIWSQYLQDDAAFNVHVLATGSLPPTVIGGAVPEFGAANITDIEAALSRDATSAYDTDAVSSIGTLLSPGSGSQYSAVFNDAKSQSSELAITTANAKALSWQRTSEPDAIDGYIVFNDLSKSSYSWDYDFARASTASSQEVDFLGMALHELGHVMGFTSGVDIIESADGPAGLNNTSLFDLFRYSERSAGLGAIEMTAGEDAYFSLDGGQTSLASLSAGYVEGADTTGGFQASHWKYQPEESDSELLLFDNATQGSAPRSLFSTLLPTVSTLLPTVSAITDLALYTVGTFTSPVLNLVGQLGQRIISPLVDPSQLPESVGIMDEMAVPGTRPEISELDLLALDVIGYDISDNASSSINYNVLLKETETALSEELGVDINSLDNVLNLEPLIQDKQASLENLFERRRSRRRSRTFLFFQETDSTASDDTAQALQSQPVELTELSNTLNNQSSQSESERIDQSNPDTVSESISTSADVTQPTETHSASDPQSNLESRYGIGQPEANSVDSLIGYNYNRFRFSPWARFSRDNRSGRRQKFSARLGLFEMNSRFEQSSNRSVDQLVNESLESTYSRLGSASSTTPTNSHSNDDFPWRQNAVEALGVESVKQMLSSWWG